MFEYTPVPRLTDALERLRNGNLEDGFHFGQPEPAAETSRTSRRASDEHEYTALVRDMSQYVDAEEKGLFERKLKAVEHIAHEFASLSGGAPVRTHVQNACLSLVQIFGGCPPLRATVRVGAREQAQLAATFGPVSDTQQRRALRAVAELREPVGERTFEQLVKATGRIVAAVRRPTRRGRKGARRTNVFDTDGTDTATTTITDGDDERARKAFGHSLYDSIKVPTKKDFVDYNRIMEDELEVRWCPYTLDDAQSATTSASAFAGNSFASGPTDDQSNFVLIADRTLRSGQDASQQVGRRWQLTLAGLIEELSTVFSEELDAVCRQLFMALESEKSTDELQMELLDLLGFDRFELLGQILQKRRELVLEYRAAVPKSQPAQPPVEWNPAPRLKGPAANQQVTVQSELELLLQKDLRKQSRKLRTQQKTWSEQPEATELLNVEEVRQRELALEAAQAEPLFDRQETMNAWRDYREQYANLPYVYDSMLQTKMNPLVVSGAKFLLPESTQRTDRRHSEEIHIPAQSKEQPDIGRIVNVTDMDELCRSAFTGVRRLNVIQSRVFDQAYFTNENLLICAPTGAGKTNIALLCVLKVLKDFRNADTGVIAKNDFKIVYVAPMKALATEMTRNFGTRLAPLGITVKELTGDMQLTKKEIMDTQMLVVTPEKWDVVTRKSTGDLALSQLVKLLIIDEVHLLHDDRGPVIETLVARTLRQVEMRQSPIRLLALSATLPNYLDVAHFLRVSPEKGLFFFDGRFRPVPLSQTFIGVKSSVGSSFEQSKQMDEICFDKALQFVRDGHQVLVFVHARNATGRTALFMKETALTVKGATEAFAPRDTPQYHLAVKAVAGSRNTQLRDLFPAGFGIHHAGMLRRDRLLVERLFAEGHIKVLCCTATLAWGVNLPAHAVIIKGTEIYDAKHGAFVDVGILDVQQIFGRAGRPQFDVTGHGLIITKHDRLYKYLAMLTRQAPIESQFSNAIMDNLNAEVVLGTVSTVDEAVKWLDYTYYMIRARKNPLAYGLSIKSVQEDPQLHQHRHELVCTTAAKLDSYQMLRYDHRNGSFQTTDLGRTASHYYVKCNTVELVVHGDGPIRMHGQMTDAGILSLISHAREFGQLKIRDDELAELDELVSQSANVEVIGGTESVFGKVNILIQAYLSRAFIQSFSLVSDTAYVVQNCGRIARFLFEIALRKGWAMSAAGLLLAAKSIEKQQWPNQHPFRQFRDAVAWETIEKLEARHMTVERIRELDARDITNMLRSDGKRIKSAAYLLPMINIETEVRPITRTILQLTLLLTADFTWDPKYLGRGGSCSFWIWVENTNDNFICHWQYFQLLKKQADTGETQRIVLTIPIQDANLADQYAVRCMSDHWLCPDTTVAVSLHNVVLPEQHHKHTDLLNLRPLSVQVLNDPKLAELFPFDYFNAIQTQIFHCMYHTDRNALVGAPTGSGKTVAAELAIFKVFREQPDAKCVYIAPMKALVRERMKDWKERIERKLGKKVVELTGDFTPDVEAIRQCSLIVTTPEKWDGVSRSWQNRSYVKNVALVVIDEIHLLGQDRGPVLEVIVARMNFMSKTTDRSVRIVGLSTALANAGDLAQWLNITDMGLYNFRPSVRPVPTEVHIAGFAGQHYCPRMASMNKPAFRAIETYSPTKPSLIFVASRRQTRLTALDLITLLAADDNPRKWLHMDPNEMDVLIETARDENLKLTLAFGIGMHHAGLTENDRTLVEQLFVGHKIQVLIATATLAWGVNTPAHLVIIKGTEYYDGKTKRYVDFPVTDVLQMMGRAGRPQYDDHGIAVVYVQDTKKHYYKKFLYEPFPVESSLLEVLSDHMNAEIVAGTVKTKQDAVDYLTWTYFFRRLIRNPTYYNLAQVDQSVISEFLTRIVDNSIADLIASSCVDIAEDERSIACLPLGQIASFYYLQHRTMRLFKQRLHSNCSVEEILLLLSDVPEYDEIPVRHNEDLVNAELSKRCRIGLPASSMESAHTKVHLLYQSHFSRLTLPSTDYITDLKSVLDQAIRILQAMLDVSADSGWLATSLSVVTLLQSIVQGRWYDDPPLSTLGLHLEPISCRRLMPVETIPELQVKMKQIPDFILKRLADTLNPREIAEVERSLVLFPSIRVRQMTVRGWWHYQERTEAKRVPLAISEADQRTQPWLQVQGDQQYLLTIQLERLNAMDRGDGRAFAPRFPKQKDQGWLLMLADVEQRQMIALKRLAPMRTRVQSANVTFWTPATPQRRLYRVYVLSDSYLGMDQQFDVRLEILEPSVQSQLNAEVNG